MPINIARAETLKEMRKKKGVSQEKLAEAIDSHQVYISEIENGKKIPSLVVLHKISIYFGIQMSEFIATLEEKL